MLVSRAIPRTVFAPIPPKDSTARKSRLSRSQHLVDPFRRRLPEGQSPSFSTIVEADQFGINLQGPGYPAIQYTFVHAHARGAGSDDLREYRYRHGYRAAKTLDTILTIVGL
jgi:hypothetical protein